MSRLRVTSAAFVDAAEIPREHTCEGEDTSPPLAWNDAPSGTESFALVVDDPDAPDPAAPKTTWVHWVLYDIPATVTTLAKGARAPEGAREGKNDWGRTGYGGPCPPIGRHRYFHKVYALDSVLGERGALTKAELERVMKGHVLAEGQLVGTYEKKQKR